MKTSEISKIVGISKRTLQFYDDEGMIKVERSENNYRLYDERTLETLWEIIIYKEMGMKIGEIKQLLDATEDQKNLYLNQQRRTIENQIIELKVQIELILMFQKFGVPKVPLENEGVTYLEKIREIKEEIKKEILKRKK